MGFANDIFRLPDHDASVNLMARTLNMGLINKGDCSDEGLMLETSAKHHIPQVTNIPYQHLVHLDRLLILLIWLNPSLSILEFPSDIST